MKIFPPVLYVSLAEYLQILKRCTLSAKISALVTIIHVKKAVLDGVKRIVPSRI